MAGSESESEPDVAGEALEDAVLLEAELLAARSSPMPVLNRLEAEYALNLIEEMPRLSSQEELSCGQRVESPIHMPNDNEVPPPAVEVEITESDEATPPRRPGTDFAPTQRAPRHDSSSAERPSGLKVSKPRKPSAPRKPRQTASQKTELIKQQVEQNQAKIDLMSSNVDKITQNLTLMSTQLSTLAAMHKHTESRPRSASPGRSHHSRSTKGSTHESRKSAGGKSGDGETGPSLRESKSADPRIARSSSHAKSQGTSSKSNVSTASKVHVSTSEKQSSSEKHRASHSVPPPKLQKATQPKEKEERARSLSRPRGDLDKLQTKATDKVQPKRSAGRDDAVLQPIVPPAGPPSTSGLGRDKVAQKVTNYTIPKKPRKDHDISPSSSPDSRAREHAEAYAAVFNKYFAKPKLTTQDTAGEKSRATHTEPVIMQNDLGDDLPVDDYYDDDDFGEEEYDYDDDDEGWEDEDDIDEAYDTNVGKGDFNVADLTQQLLNAALAPPQPAPQQPAQQVAAQGQLPANANPAIVNPAHDGQQQQQVVDGQAAGGGQPADPGVPQAQQPQQLSALALDNMLKDLETMYAEELETGPEVNPRLAILIERMIRTQLSEEATKAKLRACPPPSNVPLITLTRVNSQVWEALWNEDRLWDVEMQKLLHPVMVGLRHATYALDRQMKIATPDDETSKNLLSCISVLAIFANRLNYKRRADIRHALKATFQPLCSTKLPWTQWLFGDDIETSVKDLATARTLARRLRGTNRPRGDGNRGRGRGRFRGRGRAGRNRGGYRGRGDYRTYNSDRRPYRGRGRGRGYRGKRRYESGDDGAYKRRRDDEEDSDKAHNVRGNYSVLEPRQVDSHVGALPYFVDNWREITNDPVILAIVTHGVSIDFIKVPKQDEAPETHVNQDEAVYIDKEVKKMLQAGIIEKCRKIKGEYVSKVFTRIKKDGVSRRMIINLKPIKAFIKYQKFKMDTFRSCLNIVHKNDFCASIDLSDAYYTVPMNHKFKKYVRFIWRGVRYQYRVLAMGLSPAPRQFTKLLKPVMAYLQQQNIAVSAYLDDLFIASPTREKCMRDIRVTVEVLQNLGFHVNIAKSIVQPTRCITHLGYTINTVTMQVTLSDDKLEKVQARARPLLTGSPSIRQFMSFIGTVESCCVAVEHGRMHKHALETCKNDAIVAGSGKLNDKMELTAPALRDMNWWLKYNNEDPLTIMKGAVDVVIYTDASDQGWGAVSQGVPTGGRWAPRERAFHINAKELLAVEFGLKSLLGQLKNKHIQIFSDNTTAVAFVRKMGGCKSRRCNAVALRIWNWALQRNNWLSIAYIPGVDNVKADKESREFNDRTEWKLNVREFQYMVKHFQEVPDVDLFASRLNFQLPRYVSWNPDPGAIATDAFTLMWTTGTYYAFPPFSLIARVLQKTIQDGARMMIIVPCWPTQPWWAMLQRLLVKPPLLLLKSTRVIQLPFAPEEIHPLCPKLQLQACLISGRNWRGKV